MNAMMISAAELGDAIARHLGTPKTMERMTTYLHYVQPHRAEETVDEMPVIRSEINVWQEKTNHEQTYDKPRWPRI